MGWFETVQPNKRFGSFVDNPEMFDAAFFNVPQPEAQAMDAQQRLLLETSFEAMQGATARDLPGHACITFLSCSQQLSHMRCRGKTCF